MTKDDGNSAHSCWWYHLHQVWYHSWRPPLHRLNFSLDWWCTHWSLRAGFLEQLCCWSVQHAAPWYSKPSSPCVSILAFIVLSSTSQRMQVIWLLSYRSFCLLLHAGLQWICLLLSGNHFEQESAESPERFIILVVEVHHICFAVLRPVIECTIMLNFTIPCSPTHDKLRTSQQGQSFIVELVSVRCVSWQHAENPCLGSSAAMYTRRSYSRHWSRFSVATMLPPLDSVWLRHL